jgi:hypothetical protein
VLLERIFQRRIGDGSSVVGDRRGRHYGDNLEDLFLREAGSDERIEFLVAQMPAFLNERPRQCGKCSKSLVRGYAALANCCSFFRTDSLLKSQRSVERHRIRAGVRDGVSQQNNLIFLLAEARAMYLPKQANQGVDEFR